MTHSCQEEKNREEREREKERGREKEKERVSRERKRAPDNFFSLSLFINFLIFIPDKMLDHN